MAGIADGEPRLRGLLTIIITTSPIASHPSTMMLDTLLSTFKLVGCAELLECRKIIVCDGYNPPMARSKTRNPKYRRRKNISVREAANYELFVRRLRDDQAEHTGRSLSHVDDYTHEEKEEEEEEEEGKSIGIGSRVDRIQRRASESTDILAFGRGQRLGFALALREAIALVETDFVMVVQHDWAFLKSFPLKRIVRAMCQFPEIKYVGLKSKSSLNYVETACVRNPELRTEMVNHEPKYGLPLYPLLFWYDKTHICSTAHYRNFVFRDQPIAKTVNVKETGSEAETFSAQSRSNRSDVTPSSNISREVFSEGGADTTSKGCDRPAVGVSSRHRVDGSLKAVPSTSVPQWHAGLFKPGDFIEDTLGHAELMDIRSNGFQAHQKYGTYLYDDDGGAVISHLDGRRYLTPSQRERRGMPRHIVRSGPAYVREALQVYHE